MRFTSHVMFISRANCVYKGRVVSEYMWEENRRHGVKSSAKKRV